MTRLAAIAAAVLCLAAPGLARASPADQAVAEAPALGGRPPILEATIYPYRSHRWTALNAYVIWDPPAAGARAQPRWAIRRVRGRLDAREAADWAVSSDCPALAEALSAARTLTAPAIAIPGMEPEDDLHLMLDGVGYRLRARFGRYPRGHAVGDVEMTGNTDSPLAAWTEKLLTGLEGCWRPDPPIAP